MRSHRFEALDSWRGIAACMVALFHLRAYSHMADTALVQHAFLFVDFFFVLSGFVLAAAYAERLTQGFSVWQFMWLRFGRVYPLHLAVLAAFVAAHAVQGGAFDTPGHSAAALAGNLILVHSLGLFDALTWNMPSWSISTEFFTYLAFACGAAFLGQRLHRALVVVALACPLALLHLKGHINASHDFGMLRCLYGFSVGVLAWEAFRRWGAEAPRGTRAEIVSTGVAVGFVALAGERGLSLLAPLVFAAVVVVFARQAGALSAVLRTRAFVWLGVLSYSIYMVHFFIARHMVELVALAREHRFPGIDFLGVEKWAGDVALAFYMLLVLAVSALTYRLVEAPAREWFRRMALRPAMAVAAS